MINNQNSHHFLRCLVKMAEDRPLKLDEIPKEFIDFFSLPGLSQCINLSIDNIPEIDMDKVEDYFKNKSFTDFDDVATAIRSNFQTEIEKLYASFYYVTQNVIYDEERLNMKKRDYLSIQNIFDTKKGVCVEFAKYFRELAKRVGIDSNKTKILCFDNASKGSTWDSYSPPSKPDFNHESNYIKFDNQSYLSDPTWGSGGSKDDCRSFFLIPYYKGILNYFPDENSSYETLDCNFTWDRFISLNKPHISRDLCFESNPFQRITVEDGFYDLQFSFIQPLDIIFGCIYHFKDNEWCEKEDKYISFNCLGKNLPRHNFSFSNQLRCRYNMSISFPEKGEYKVKVYVDNLCIFTVYFDVKCETDKLLGIYGHFKEKFGFIPVVPMKGLTEIENGFAQIRFAVKLSRSHIAFELYSIKKGTYNEENEFKGDDWYNYFTTNLPFNYNEENLNDYLVEDWILVNFPSDGRWKVRIYFDNGNSSFIHGVDYYFDVTGTKEDNNIFPFFNLPNNRTIASSKIKIKENVCLEPSTQTVIKEDGSFYFHIFSEIEVVAFFKKDKTDNPIIAELISVKDTDDKNIKDYEFSAPYLEKGYYKLKILNKENFNTIAIQQYFITGKLKKESKKEKKLMKELKKSIEGKIDLLKDVPSSIRKTVENMVEKSISDANSNKNIEKINILTSSYESSEDNYNLRTQISELKETVSTLKMQNEEKDKYSHSLEQEKNEIKRRFDELKKQIENESKEKNELMVRLREFEKIKKDLNNKISKLEKQNEETIQSMEKQKIKTENQLEKIQKLEQENNSLNSQIKKLKKQQEKRENYIHSLELQNDEKNKKIEKLLKQEKETNNEIKKGENVQKVNDFHGESDKEEEEECIAQVIKDEIEEEFKGNLDNDENDFKRTKQEESINSPDSNENSITVHQPNRQNNSPRRNKCLPYHKMTLMYLCKMTHNPKKIYKIEKRPSQISLKQTKNDEISSNHNNIIQSHVLDDLHLPQQQLILKNDDILPVSEEVNDIIENQQVIKLPKKEKK